MRIDVLFNTYTYKIIILINPFNGWVCVRLETFIPFSPFIYDTSIDRTDVVVTDNLGSPKKNIRYKENMNLLVKSF